jgi:hypothetical protein
MLLSSFLLLLPLLLHFLLLRLLLLLGYLQLIPNRLPTQIWHSHNLDDQASPTREMLGSLAFACLRVVLLPREARLLPAFVDGVDEIFAKVGIQLLGTLLMRSLLLGNILFMLALCEKEVIYQ